MRQAEKFLFDRCFAPPTNGRDGHANGRDRRPAEFERELAEARTAAFEKGRKDGEAEARAALEGRLADTADALAERVERMAGQMTQECEAIRAQAVQIALAAAERLSREFLRRQPMSEIEAAFDDCVAYIAHAPQVSVSVGADVAEPLRARLAAIATERGFAGRVAVTGDPDMQAGDCRIEWADGGLARDFESLRRDIDETLGRHLAARAAPDSDANVGQNEQAQGGRE